MQTSKEVILQKGENFVNTCFVTKWGGGKYCSKPTLLVLRYLPEPVLQIIYRGFISYVTFKGRHATSQKINRLVANYDIQHIPLFTQIEIETVNRCNGSCSFCPVNVHEKQRPYAKMSETLFQKIIDELGDLDYSGRLALFSNNEPYLDDRMVSFIQYAREKVPHAYLHLFTNGSVLTLEKFLGSMKYLDRMVIDNYNDDKALNSKVQIIEEYCRTHPKTWSGDVIISMRLQNEILTSRGGQAPNKTKTKGVSAKCMLPFDQLIIRPDGKISLCCNDALGKYTLGDVTTQSLADIWDSKSYHSIREEMQVHGRKYLDLCKNCDTLHLWEKSKEGKW